MNHVCKVHSWSINVISIDHYPNVLKQIMWRKIWITRDVLFVQHATRRKLAYLHFQLCVDHISCWCCYFYVKIDAPTLVMDSSGTCFLLLIFYLQLQWPATIQFTADCELLMRASTSSSQFIHINIQKLNSTICYTRVPFVSYRDLNEGP